MRSHRPIFGRALIKATALGTCIGIAAVACPQSIYIDLDAYAGNEQNGNGEPSSSFAAASGVPGAWNRVNCVSPGPEHLFDINGKPTNAVYTVPVGSGSGGGSPNPLNSGDYARLLNDYARIPERMKLTISGLDPGGYRVWVYAVNVLDKVVPVQVSVGGAIQGQETVTGPMPGNRFEYLVTHSMHDLPSLSGDLEIYLTAPWPNGMVNGLQILAVPEPESALALLAGVAAFAIRRRCRN